MSQKNKYLALVNKDFEMNDDVTSYFQSKGVQVINYFKNIGVLELHSDIDLTTGKYKFVSHIEKDKEFRASKDEEQ